MVVGMDVVPQLSPACKPWKFIYIDGEVLSLYQDNVGLSRWGRGRDLQGEIAEYCSAH